jgi:S1-C subfamily serine protease
VLEIKRCCGWEPLWTLPLSALAVGLVSGCVTPFSEEFRRDAARHLMVGVELKETAQSQSDAQAHGSGIIIGADPAQLYIVTAEHVVHERSGLQIGLSSPLWPERTIDAHVRHESLDPDGDSYVVDWALLIAKRPQVHGKLLPLPFWPLLPDDIRIDPGAAVKVLGRQHGFVTTENADARVSNPGASDHVPQDQSEKPGVAAIASNRPSSDEFTMTPTLAPTPGDSGGAVFDARWRLLGMYTGTGSGYHAVRIDRLLEHVRGIEGGESVPIELETAPRFVPRYLAYIGAALVVAGAGTGITALVRRHKYYADPDRGDEWVKPLNATADALMATGAVVLTFHFASFIRTRRLERSVRKEWAQ